jgi:hypothetical protein
MNVHYWEEIEYRAGYEAVDSQVAAEQSKGCGDPVFDDDWVEPEIGDFEKSSQLTKWEAILAQYNVTEEQAVFAAENADRLCRKHGIDASDEDCSDWLEWYASSLGAFEEENERSNH